MSQDIQDKDEDMKCDVLNTDYQGQIGRRDSPISQRYGYLIQSFKDFCEQYHDNSICAKLDEVKNYLETKMWSMK